MPTWISIVVVSRSRIIVITRCFIPHIARLWSRSPFLGFNFPNTLGLPSSVLFLTSIVFLWSPSNTVILLRKRCCFNCSSSEVVGVRGCWYTSSRTMNTLCIRNSKNFTIPFKSCSVCCFKCLSSILNLHEHNHNLLFQVGRWIKKKSNTHINWGKIDIWTYQAVLLQNLITVQIWNW